MTEPEITSKAGSFYQPCRPPLINLKTNQPTVKTMTAHNKALSVVWSSCHQFERQKACQGKINGSLVFPANRAAAETKG